MVSLNPFDDQGQMAKKLLKELINAILKNIEDKEQIEEDSFELYSLQLQKRIYKNEKDCEERFLKGYQTLLAYLRRQDERG